MFAVISFSLGVICKCLKRSRLFGTCLDSPGFKLSDVKQFATGVKFLQRRFQSTELIQSDIKDGPRITHGCGRGFDANYSNYAKKSARMQGENTLSVCLQVMSVGGER